MNATALLGESLDLSDNVADVLEEFLSSLYGLKEEISINETRYRLFKKEKRYRIKLFTFTAGDDISYILPMNILPQL